MIGCCISNKQTTSDVIAHLYMAPGSVKEVNLKKAWLCLRCPLKPFTDPMPGSGNTDRRLPLTCMTHTCDRWNLRYALGQLLMQ
jgi:hypothetical protein